MLLLRGKGKNRVEDGRDTEKGCIRIVQTTRNGRSHVKRAIHVESGHVVFTAYIKLQSN